MYESNEAIVVLSKCAKVHRIYGIRTEHLSSNSWRFTWAFPIKEVSAKREGYDHTKIGGSIDYSDDFPGCPYCGQKNFVVCNCGRISCTVLKNGIFTCDWCGAQGTIGEYNGQAINAESDL